ncbi:hypothetical protein [Agrobacterium tumefaciens]|uniref:hypothetical protein n=1 Tax=Agrobacterium tumefaciens TaxID=358 RepID=UPI003BA0E7C5
MPDVWLPAVRFALSQLRRVRDGKLYVDAEAVHMVIRAVKIVKRRYSVKERATVGFEVVAPTARGRTHQAILSVLSAAQHSVEAAEKTELGCTRAADIERDITRYVNECLIGRRVVEYRHVVHSGNDDSEWTQAAYIDLVVTGVRAFVRGATVEGLSESDRSRFLTIYKSEE